MVESNKDIREKAYRSALSFFDREGYTEDEKLRTIFSMGCVFGFALGTDEEFNNWESAAKAFELAMSDE